MDFRATSISLSYLGATVLFILGLKFLSSPRTARTGNRLAAVGMFLATVATLLDRQVVSYWAIIVAVNLVLLFPLLLRYLFPQWFRRIGVE